MTEILHPPKSAILKASGINCDAESQFGMEQAGAIAEIVHLNELIERMSIDGGYQNIFIPGGFSFGDDFRAGGVMRLELQHRFKDVLTDHLEKGRTILGVCNGFQILVQLGLLPFGHITDLDEITTTLAPNASGKFESRWVNIKPENRMLLPDGEVLSLPVAHREGRLLASETVIGQIEQQGLVGWRYCTVDGTPTNEYPANPNGSIHAIEGLIDPDGQVIGMMAHPERYVLPEHYVNWHRNQDMGEPHGLRILKQIVEMSR